jgi:ribosome maturation factor RimP
VRRPVGGCQKRADPNPGPAFFFASPRPIMTDSIPTSTRQIVDRERLEAVVAPIAHAHGAEVVDHEFKSEPGGWILRIFLEKLGSAASNASTENAAVDLELCTKVARDVSPALDVADLIPHRYHLEVSSPGIERPLRAKKDFIRFAGKKAKLKLLTAVRGQKVVVGILGPAMGETLSLLDGAHTYEIPFAAIASARLVFEFGPAPKPGKKR